jgi:glycosyltransferase involved in cell wall biosynthesis
VKILHLLYESKGDYFGIGGVGVRAYEIYARLKSRHDITLLCKKYPGARDADIEGLRHVFVGAESRSLTKTLLSYAFHSILFVKKHGKEFDIIIEEFSPAVPTFLHMFSHRPCVLQIQGYTGTLYFKKYNAASASVLYCLEHLRPRFYEYFIGISAETMKRLSVGQREYVEIIPNGVPAELISQSPGVGEYILYLGRIDIYGKGLDILINAYSEFLQAFPSIKLVIAGDGRDMERFRDELKKLPDKVRKNIELLGWISGGKKKEILGKALYVVLPSRHEVQGISALEAMACGKAVLVSNIPELSYVVRNKAGISFESGNISSLAQSMKDLMNEDEQKTMGESGMAWVKAFTWDKMAERYENFLHRVLEKSGGNL